MEDDERLGAPEPQDAPMGGSMSQKMKKVRHDADPLEREAVLANVQRGLLGAAPRPAQIDRFLVLARLGAGAAGVVYSAYDPRLDRKVALKFLRREGDQIPTGGRERLLREAQTLAKLSHANVVSIHDFGEYQGRIFLAMEFVDGADLRAWLAEGPHAWREVLATFRAAGEGLAAAHDAGLVHRDFKPDNVLIDKQGNVRVADFGLARELCDPTEDIPTEEVSAEGSSERAPVQARLTQTGALVGTPAYMSPEQYSARPASPRSDQFSFCVALFEGLYGTRPFPGTTVAQLVEATLAGDVAPTPTRAQVPGWVRRAILRGLASDPAERWPDMHALLAALARNPRKIWLQRGGLVAAAALIGSIGLGVGARTTRARACSGLASELDGVWDDARRGAVRQAILGSLHPAADRVWEQVDRSLTQYADTWLTARTAACMATRVESAASNAILDRRVLCLDRARQALDAAAAQFQIAEAAALTRARDIVPAARNVAQCGARRVLEAGVPPPSDPAVRARIATVDAELAAITVRLNAGYHDDATRRADAAVAEAVDLGFEPLLARALLQQGAAHTAGLRFAPAREAFVRAVGHAERGGADLVRADALRRWARRAADLGDISEAQRIAAQAEAALQRFPKDDDEQTILSTAAYIAEAQGHVEAALQKAAPLWERRRGKFDEDPDAYVEAALQWARLSIAAKRPAATVEAQLAEVLEATVAAWGPLDPAVASLKLQLSHARLFGGDSEGAQTAIEEVLAIRRAVVGPDDPTLLPTLSTYAAIAYSVGDYDQALRRYQQVIEQMERIHGRDALPLAEPLHNTGLVLFRLGQVEEAVAFDQHALRIRLKHLGEHHPKTATAHYNVALTYHRGEKHQAAIEHFKRAASIYREERIPADLVDTQIALAEALCDADRCDESVAPLRRAFTTATEVGLPERERARVEFCLGRALHGRGEVDEGLRLTRAALQRFTAAKSGATFIGHVDGWLAEHDPDHHQTPP